MIKRILGPEMLQATGTIRLLGDDLDAFGAGRITLAVFGSIGADPVAERALTVARR